MKALIACLLAFAFAATGHAVDWSKKLPLSHTTPYFKIHYQRQAWDAAAFGRFADAFVALVDHDFFPVKFDFPVEVAVLPDRESFQQFCRKEFGDRKPPNFGMYLPSFKVFATFESSGLGTFTNQIMQPLVDRDLAAGPRWATAAIPTFFEKFVGYWDDDRLVMQWGYHNAWRIDDLGDKLTSLDLGRIVSNQQAVSGLNNNDRRLVTMFLWQQGRLERFLRMIAGRERHAYGSYFEAAMEKSLADIVPLWKAYLEEISSHRAEALRIPASFISRNRAEFDRMMAELKPWRQTPAAAK